MAAPVHCRVESARIRANKEEALTGLIHQLFNRRHLSYVAASERAWLTAELVQSLRRQSTVYREMSTKTSGPLPFGLGYFRVRDGQLELVSDSVPVEEPKVLVRLLSEFLQPGARLYFGAANEAQGWQVNGIDAVEPITGDRPDEARASDAG